MPPFHRPASSPLLKRNKNLLISIPALVLPYAGIVLLAMFAEKMQSWAVRFAVLPLVVALQMHLQILQHEGAHYLLCRNRRWNDRLSEILCSIPFLNLLRHYRHFHLLHHRHLLDPNQDPEVGFYQEQHYTFKRKKPLALVKMLFLDLCGYHYLQFFFSYNVFLFKETCAGRLAKPTKQEKLCSIFVLGAFLLITFYFGFELLFYWFLPQATLLFFFLKLHGYGEHAERSSTIEDSTYAHELNIITRFFLYPLNSDYHLEHHLDPSLPWHQLRTRRKQTPLVCQNYFFGTHSILKTVLLITKEK